MCLAIVYPYQPLPQLETMILGEQKMNNRTELENKLAHEIHYLPIEAVETMLQLVSLIKKTNPVRTKQQANNFADFIRNSPLMGVDIDLTRDPSLCRNIEL
jgi:hypothetical protein